MPRRRDDHSPSAPGGGMNCAPLSVVEIDASKIYSCEDSTMLDAVLRWRRSVEWTADMRQFAIRFDERFLGTAR